MFLDDLREALEERGSTQESSGGGSKTDYRWYYPPFEKKDRSVVRVLPRWEENKAEPWPGVFVSYHYNLLPDKYKKKKALCLKTHGMDCPICSVIAAIEPYAQGVTDALDKYRPIEKSYMNVLVVEDTRQEHQDTPSDIPYIMGPLSGYTLEWICNSLLDPEIGNFIDPKSGSNVIFKRESDGGKFSRQIARAQTPIAPTQEEIDEILANSYDLKGIWRKPDDNFIKRINDRAKQIAETLVAQVSIQDRKLGEKIDSAVQKLDLTSFSEEGSQSTDRSPEPKVEAPAQEAPEEDVSLDDIEVPATEAKADTTVSKEVEKKKGLRQVVEGAPPGLDPEKEHCFGNPDEYEKDEEKKQECTLCPFEWECNVSIKEASGN